MRKVRIIIFSGLEDELKYAFEKIFEQDKDNSPRMNYENFIEIGSLNIVEKLNQLHDDYIKENTYEDEKIKMIPPGKGFVYSNQVKKKEELTPLHIYSEGLSRAIFNHKPDIILIDMYTNSMPIIGMNIECLCKNIIVKINRKCIEYNQGLLNGLIHHHYQPVFRTIFEYKNTIDCQELKELVNLGAIIDTKKLNTDSTKMQLKKFLDTLMEEKIHKKRKELVLK